jgi:concentrative nucleoside transporter, CNT family
MNIHQLIGAFGIVTIIFLCWLLSSHKRKMPWRVVFWGIGLQFTLGFLILKTSPGQHFFQYINKGLLALMDFHEQGARFVFGALAISPGNEGSLGFMFAFQILTTILFFSALISILYHFGIMQILIAGIAKVMKFTMGTSGGETLSASANIFVGQIEAPMMIRPFLNDLTRSELLCVMIGGMATISGSLLGAFIGMLKGFFPDIGIHLMTASVMAAPAAIVISKVLLPETEETKTSTNLKEIYKRPHKNLIEAIVTSIEVALKTVLAVAATLIVFIALMALADYLFEGFFSLFGIEGFNLQKCFGYIFMPLAWIIGVPWQDCFEIGRLIGAKMMINEVVAYTQLGTILAETPGALADRSVMIVTYALCGFANFLSIGIQVSGIGAMAPSRRPDLAKLGMRALVGGVLTTCMTAAVAGIIIP